MDDTADFILQTNFQDCAGFMTFGPDSTYGEDGTGAETIYMILTWVGIVVTMLALVAWVVWREPAAGSGMSPNRRRPATDEWTTATARRSGRHPMTNNGSGKKADRVPAAADSQQELRVAMLAISILCAIVVLVIVLFTNIGNEFRPTL